jgi:peptidoglycan/LPS O-acetylase OafA/YrhL
MSQSFLISASFAIFFWAILIVGGVPPGWLRKVSKFGRESSYSLYLCHYPLLLLLCGFIVPGNRLAFTLLSGCLVIGLAIVCCIYGFVFSKGTERYTAVLRNRMLRIVDRSRTVTKPA